MKTTWEDQLERVRRWLERLREIDAGMASADRDTKHLEDDVRAFFVECSHLADHLSASTPPLCSWDDISSWRATHPALETCRQICNGAKHLRPKTKLHQQAVRVVIQNGLAGVPNVTTHGVTMVVMPGGESALNVAEQAVKDWEELIQSKMVQQ